MITLPGVGYARLFHDLGYLDHQYLTIVSRVSYRVITHSITASFININVNVKVGFHYPSSRAEFTGRVHGPS